MPEATFRHGDPVAVDYTPGTAIAAGQVVALFGAALTGGVAIAHLDIAANTLGAVAVGGGVYEVTADAAIANGALVFWDDTANRVTATATGNRQFGYLVSASTGVGALCWAFHQAA